MDGGGEAVGAPPAIAAATVVVVRDARDGSGGVEALLLRRNATGTFGGLWVFPGGRVDRDDADPDAPGDDWPRPAAPRRAKPRRKPA